MKKSGLKKWDLQTHIRTYILGIFEREKEYIFANKTLLHFSIKLAGCSNDDRLTALRMIAEEKLNKEEGEDKKDKGFRLIDIFDEIYDVIKNPRKHFRSSVLRDLTRHDAEEVGYYMKKIWFLAHREEITDRKENEKYDVELSAVEEHLNEEHRNLPTFKHVTRPSVKRSVMAAAPFVAGVALLGYVYTLSKLMGKVDKRFDFFLNHPRTILVVLLFITLTCGGIYSIPAILGSFRTIVAAGREVFAQPVSQHRNGLLSKKEESDKGLGDPEDTEERDDTHRRENRSSDAPSLYVANC